MNAKELMIKLAPLFYQAHNRGLSYQFSAIDSHPSERDRALQVYEVFGREVSAFSVTLTQCYAYCPDLGYKHDFTEAESFIDSLIGWLTVHDLLDTRERVFAKFIINTTDVGAVRVKLSYP